MPPALGPNWGTIGPNWALVASIGRPIGPPLGPNWGTSGRVGAPERLAHIPAHIRFIEEGAAGWLSGGAAWRIWAGAYTPGGAGWRIYPGGGICTSGAGWRIYPACLYAPGAVPGRSHIYIYIYLYI